MNTNCLKKIVLLCGFQGSGKSYFIRKFKKDLDDRKIASYDSDVVIANKLLINPLNLGKKIEEIGWEEFRKIEREVVSNLIYENECAIIALGGGALSLEFIDLMDRNRIKLVWINRSFESCYKEIFKDSNRPLSKLKKDDLFNLYAERHEVYKRSDLVLNCEEITMQTFLKVITLLEN